MKLSKTGLIMVNKGASSFLDLDELDFFDPTNRFVFTDPSDKPSQSELLGDVDSPLFRFFLPRRSHLDFLVFIDESESDRSDDGGESAVASIMVPRPYPTRLSFPSFLRLSPRP